MSKPKLITLIIIPIIAGTIIFLAAGMKPELAFYIIFGILHWILIVDRIWKFPWGPILYVINNPRKD